MDNQRNGKNGAIRRLRAKKGESLKSLYAKAKRNFTAADLQKYTEIESGIPAEEVVAKLKSLAKRSKKG